MVWSCPIKSRQVQQKGRPFLDIRTVEQWETALLSSDLEVEVELVRMAEDAAEVQGLLAAA